jgi:hypothetical protein
VRSLCAGMMMLSASMAVVDIARAQIQPQRLSDYGSAQAPIGYRQPSQYDLQPAQDHLKKIDKNNQELDLPPSGDEITGAGQVGSKEDALTNRIGQENPALDNEIIDIRPSCVRRRGCASSSAVVADPPRVQAPTRAYELRALREQDAAPGQAQETDLRYDRLMSSSSRIRGHRATRAALKPVLAIGAR